MADIIVAYFYMALERTDFITSIYVGRDELMAWLERTILPGNLEERIEHCPLVLLYGRPGIGKTTVCQQFLKTHLTRSSRTQPFFAFNWKGGVHGRSVVRFSKLLFRMGVANISLEGADQNLLMVNVSQGTANNLGSPDDTRGAEPSDPEQRYREDGVVEDLIDSPQGLSGADQKALAEAFAKNLLEWMGDSLKTPSLKALGKIVFIFDDFENYHAAIRQWVGRYLYPCLKSIEALPGCAYLFTAERSWDECSFADYWELSSGSLKQYHMNALSPADCKEWLQQAGIKEDYLEILVEETEGIPAKIAPLIEQPQLLESLNQSLEHDSPLRAFNAKERRWLHAASMQDRVTLEAFELLLGRTEAAEALVWLKKHPKVCQVQTAASGSLVIQMDAKIRSTILQRAKTKIPLRHQSYTDRLELIGELKAKVPMQLHRHYLALLSPLDRLNEEVIHYVHGEDR